MESPVSGWPKKYTNTNFLFRLQDDLKTTCDMSQDGGLLPTCLSSPNLTLRKTRSGSDVGVQVEMCSARCVKNTTWFHAQQTVCFMLKGGGVVIPSWKVCSSWVPIGCYYPEGNAIIMRDICYLLEGLVTILIGVCYYPRVCVNIQKIMSLKRVFPSWGGGSVIISRDVFVLFWGMYFNLQVCFILLCGVLLS